MTNQQPSNASPFDSCVQESFAFLEAEFGMEFRGVREVAPDAPRDHAYVARYSSTSLRVDIGWNPGELSISVVIRLERDELPRRERSIYLEPFVEFITNAGVPPVVPQCYPGMSIAAIQKVARNRHDLFASGVCAVVKALAERLHDNLHDIQSVSIDTIREYHRWFQSRGRID